jgi:HEPN/Toprim N-terminal domain 1
MSSYSTLSVDDFELYSIRNEVDPTVMRLFSEDDKRVRLPPPQGQPHGAASTDAIRPGEEEDWEEAVPTVEYTISLQVARDRLEVMGFTLPYVRQAFAEGLAEALEGLNTSHLSSDPTSELLRQLYLEQEALLSTLTFDSWLHGFREILRDRPPEVDHFAWRDGSDSNLSPIVRYMLGHPEDQRVTDHSAASREGAGRPLRCATSASYK